MRTSLLWNTPQEWVKMALSDFDHFLLDHACCERKASALGLSFVVRYPDRTAILEPMIRFAREELEHFHQVFQHIQIRGLQLIPDEPDLYVNQILLSVRFGREERFLDRLLCASVIEARGAERIALIAETLTDPNLKSFYARLARAENHHKSLFVELALFYFSKEVVEERLQFFLQEEAKIIAALPFRSALH